MRGSQWTRRPGTSWISAALATLGLQMISTAAPQVTERVSLSSTGEQANAASFGPSLSTYGRLVAFASSASNLVAGDTNGVGDIFVHDRSTGIVTLESVSSLGVQANASSGGAKLSADGRYVAFSSTATNLVAGDTNGSNDVFVRDRPLGTTVRVSVSSSGVESNGHSHTPAISGDGRYVAFESAATNLVAGITNSVWDIFVHDIVTGTTERVSVSSAGGQSNGDSRFASISADGRYVSFTSQADTLVSGPTNGRTDVYVRDRALDTTERVSVSSSGALGNDNSYSSAISDDGRYVVFSSHAGNLDPADQTASEDVFVRDRQADVTFLASLSTTGVQANSWSFWPAISSDGRYIAFVSDASNLVPGDTNGRRDVFVRDLATNETRRVSVSTAGEQGNDNSGFFSGPRLSADGLHVAFQSHASNLVPGDTNGVADAFVHGPEWPMEPGAGFCFGDGSGTPCPCGNTGAAGAGCAHGAGSGAVLAASGSSSVAADDLVLHAADAVPSVSGLFFQGTTAVAGGAGSTFGDGLRCAGGSVIRLQGVSTDASGAAQSSVSLVSAGSVAPGTTLRYQLWYRDSMTSPCGGGFNLSNGYEVAWTP